MIIIIMIIMTIMTMGCTLRCASHDNNLNTCHCIKHISYHLWPCPDGQKREWSSDTQENWRTATGVFTRGGHREQS